MIPEMTRVRLTKESLYSEDRKRGRASGSTQLKRVEKQKGNSKEGNSL